MPRPTLARLPYSELVAAARIADPTGRDAAAIFAVTQRTVCRWNVHGVPLIEADKAACHIGLHPMLVWGAAWTDAEILAEVEAVERAARTVATRRAGERRRRNRNRDSDWDGVMRSWRQWCDQQDRPLWNGEL